jgi:predicted DNA binding CopG/RHH family protein
MANSNPKEIRVTVVVTEELKRKAKIKSAKTGKPIAEFVREALEAWTADDPPDDKAEK